MIVVDRSKLKAEYRNANYAEGLEDYLHKVSMLKPLATFSVSDKGIESEHYRDGEENKVRYTAWRIRVFENGERIGAISREARYRNGAKEMVYGVEGFRIKKSRGDPNTTLTADIKKAMAVVKKTFLPRQDDELTEQIRTKVTSGIEAKYASLSNLIRWDFSVESEMAFYAMEAYKARRMGDQYCSMPAKPISIKKLDEHDKKCDAFEHIGELKQMVIAKQGYGIKANVDNSLIVYSYATNTVKRYEAFNDLPEAIAQKYAVFKVLKVDEPVSHIGCMFADNFAFVVQ
jgi:hypothetical protein